MPKTITVAQFLTHAINLSPLSQKEIAEAAGFKSANVLSMMKQGITKVPLSKAPAIAEACKVDVAEFIRIAMMEYNPEVWAVIQKHVGQVLSDDELKVLEGYRAVRDKPITDTVAKQMAE